MLGFREGGATADQLAAAQQRVAELESELKERSLRDPVAAPALTLPAFRAQLEMDLQGAERGRRPLSLALIDLDNFARLNLRHGYAAGDDVLRAAAALLTERTGGLVCRLGADQFAIRLADTAGLVAQDRLEVALVGLEELRTDAVLGVSASVGVAEMTPGRSPEALFAAAGAALERARRGGRKPRLPLQRAGLGPRAARGRRRRCGRGACRSAR